MRNGSWVSFLADVPPDVGAKAHRTPDGRLVGIFCRSGFDATGEFAPERIMLVQPNGENVVTLVGSEARNVAFAPDGVRDLQPCIEADHIPEPRRRHLPAGHKLRA